MKQTKPAQALELRSLSLVFDRPVAGARLERRTVVQPSEILFFAGGLAAGVGALTAFVSFDSLLRQQHEVANEAWVKDGRAVGFFWWPKDAAHVAKATILRATLMLRWALRAPNWTEGREWPDLVSLRVGLAILLLGGAAMAFGLFVTSR